jgi:hypothetical protein
MKIEMTNSFAVMRGIYADERGMMFYTNYQACNSRSETRQDLLNL